MANDYTGRRPGGYGGFQRQQRSRPGAPLADPTRNVGSMDGPRFGTDLPGRTPTSNWENAFKNHITGANTATGKVYQPPMAPTETAGAAAGNALLDAAGAPPNPFMAGVTGAAQDVLPSLATIASGGVTPHQERWSGGPPLSSPDRSMPGAPFMPRGPGAPFTVPKPLSSPTGNAGTDAAELDANKSIYGPGGTSGFWGGTPAPYAPKQVTPNRLAGTGYESGDPNAILKQYQTKGTSVNPYGTAPSTNPFGWDRAFTG